MAGIEEQKGTDRVENELAEARHELAEAVAAEHRAETEIGAAERRIEAIEEQIARHSRIIVNGRQKEIEGRRISYEEVVKIAFPAGPDKPDMKYTVTYRNADHVPPADELEPGQSVKVKPGLEPDEETIFNVTPTILS
jgi:hypothetical protein